MPMYGNTGARTVPAAVLTSTMSPRSTSRRAAVSGCISTHELQQIFETGSGSSCNHGLFAPRPSPNTADGYVMSVRSPWLLAIDVGFAAGAAAASVRPGNEPFAMPFGSAAANAGGPPGNVDISHER